MIKLPLWKIIVQILVMSFGITFFVNLRTTVKLSLFPVKTIEIFTRQLSIFSYFFHFFSSKLHKNIAQKVIFELHLTGLLQSTQQVSKVSIYHGC